MEALRGSQLIIHAGDVGHPDILERLKELAPVICVRGNIDKGSWASALPTTAVADAGRSKICVLHDLRQFNLDRVAGVDIVVSGHSHKPSREQRGGVLYINPGSAGPRRFRLPVTVARLSVAAQPWTVRFVDLLNGNEWVQEETS